MDKDNDNSILMSAGFLYGNSATARSIGYEEEVCPTLKQGGLPC